MGTVGAEPWAVGIGEFTWRHRLAPLGASGRHRLGDWRQPMDLGANHRLQPTTRPADAAQPGPADPTGPKHGPNPARHARRVAHRIFSDDATAASAARL